MSDTYCLHLSVKEHFGVKLLYFVAVCSTSSGYLNFSPEKLVDVGVTTQPGARPSLQELCGLLLLAPDMAAIDKSIPCTVHVVYTVALATSHGGGQSWHLRAPSAATLAKSVCDLLTTRHVLAPGQIVCCSAAKTTGTGNACKLHVTVTKLSDVTEKDYVLFEHKVLEWYLMTCEKNNRVPNIVMFRNLYKNLKNRQKIKNSVQDSIDNVLSTILAGKQP